MLGPLLLAVPQLLQDVQDGFALLKVRSHLDVRNEGLPITTSAEKLKVEVVPYVVDVRLEILDPDFTVTTKGILLGLLPRVPGQLWNGHLA